MYYLGRARGLVCERSRQSRFRMGSTLPCTELERMHAGNVDKWFGWWENAKMIHVPTDKFVVWFFPV